MKSTIILLAGLVILTSPAWADGPSTFDDPVVIEPADIRRPCTTAFLFWEWEDDCSTSTIRHRISDPLTTKVKGNNGFGNGDQRAPGRSLSRNRAENEVGNPGHKSGKPQRSN